MHECRECKHFIDNGYFYDNDCSKRVDEDRLNFPGIGKYTPVFYDYANRDISLCLAGEGLFERIDDDETGEQGLPDVPRL